MIVAPILPIAALFILALHDCCGSQSQLYQVFLTDADCDDASAQGLPGIASGDVSRLAFSQGPTKNW